METELETMIVRLVGDYEDYKKAIEDAENLTKEQTALMRGQLKDMQNEIKELNKVAKEGEAVTKSVEGASEKYGREIAHLDDLLAKGAITQNTYNKALNNATKEFMQADVGLRKIGNQLTSVGTTLSVGVTAPLAALGALAVSEFSNAENAALRLEAAIAGNGGNVKALMADYTKFADQIQSVTKFEDDHILSLVQEAESYGQTGDAAKKAVKEAIGLSSVHKVSAETAVRMTSALAEGRAEMLQRYIPALKGIKDPAEKVRVAHEELAKMFKVAEADAKTFSGQLEIVKRDFGNALEPIGKIVSQGLTPLVNKAKEAVEWFSNLDASTQKWIVQAAAMAAAVGPIVLLLGQMASQIANVTTALLSMNAAQLAVIGKVGLWAALAYGMYQAAEALGVFGEKAVGLDEAQAGLNARNKEAINIADELAAKNLGEAKTIEDKKKEIERLEEMQKRLDKAAAESVKVAAEARNKNEVADDRKFGFGNREARLQAQAAAGLKPGEIAPSADEVKFFEDQAKAANAAADANNKRLEAAKAAVEFEEGKPGGPSEKDIKAFEKFNAQLDAQIQAFGHISQAARLAQYAEKGFTDAEIEASEARIAKLESLKEHDKEEKKALQSASSLESQIRSLSESMKIQIEGFDEANGKMGTHELAVAKAQAKLDDLMKTVEGGSEAYEALDRAQGELTKAMADAKGLDAMEKQQKLLKKGQELTKSQAGPQNKFNEKKRELDELLGANAISLGTYNDALEKAAELANKEYNAKFKIDVRGVDAVKAGSAEAEAQLREFVQGKQGLSLDMKPTVKSTNNVTNNDGEVKVDMESTNEILTSILTALGEKAVVSIVPAGIF